MATLIAGELGHPVTDQSVSSSRPSALDQVASRLLFGGSLYLERTHRYRFRDGGFRVSPGRG